MAMRASATLLLAGLLFSGCFRYQTQVPGVVDMRTDASATRTREPEPPRDEELSRAEPYSFVVGAGVVVERENVLVEERHVFLRGLVPVWNPSAREEIDAALGLTGGLRALEIEEEYGVVDVVLSVLASFVPVASWAVPSTYTFRLRGQALALDPLLRRDPRSAPAPRWPSPLEDLPPPPPLEEAP